MVILPIINGGKVKHAHVSLKDASKIKNGVILEGIDESDVVINQQLYTRSSYAKDKEDSSVVNFVRNSSLIVQNDYLITTREETGSDRYDVYEVKQPPKFIHQSLDNLYASIITDMRKEIPDSPKGRYLSFEKIGLDEVFTDEKLALLQRIVKMEPNSGRWPVLFEQAGVADIPRALDFLNHFDCTIVSGTSIPEENIQSVVSAMEPLNTQDYRDLKKYYQMAQTNADIYSRIAGAYHTIYQQPYHFIHSAKQKERALQKVKVPGEVVNHDGKDFAKAA